MVSEHEALRKDMSITRSKECGYNAVKILDNDTRIFYYAHALISCASEAAMARKLLDKNQDRRSWLGIVCSL